MKFLLQLLIWWKGQSIGTRIFTWRNGALIGKDNHGNKFYQSDAGKRWVIFADEIEASKISPDWHGWLHHTFDENPGTKPLPHKPWEHAHVENQSGTVNAYHPPGSILSSQPKPVSDYEAWQPE